MKHHIKTTKKGHVVEVEGKSVLVDGKFNSWRVKKIDPLTMERLNKQLPGHKMVYMTETYKEPPVLFTEEEGLTAKTLIDDAVATEKAAKTAAEKAEFEALKASGEAYRVAETTEQYGCELVWARRFNDEEKAKCAEWFRERGAYGIPGGGRRKVEREAIFKVVGDRPSDTEFYGCSNRAWTISEEDWSEIIQISNEIRTAREVQREDQKNKDEAELRRLIASGFCFNCQAWCHGDCGNYTTKPTWETKKREIDLAIREANYGISD